jgi:hypothetical protein
MKRLILAAVALLMLTSIGSAQMGRRGNGGYRAPRGGVFSRMIELERRKNAWIRENIFRR